MFFLRIGKSYTYLSIDIEEEQKVGNTAMEGSSKPERVKATRACEQARKQKGCLSPKERKYVPVIIALRPVAPA